MSVVVAIKEKGRIYIGADSQVTKGGTRTTLYNKNNYKIWKVNDLNYCIMAHVGSVRDANIVRLMGCPFDDYDEYCNNINYRFVVRRLVPTIIDTLKEYRYIKIDSDEYFDSMNSSFLFAYKDKLFVINSDGCVLEVDDYVAIGSGSSEALGSLVSTPNESPKTRIVKAIKASAASDIYVDYPIVITDTESEDFDVVTESNESRYIKNKPQKEKENN